MPLVPNAAEPSDIILAITRSGQRIKDPACLPGWKLTKGDREYLLRAGWLQFEGRYWHPRVKTTTLWARLENPEKYYPRPEKSTKDGLGDND
jgi:hypothetical protein